ncbi:hypothetical protein B0H14DRAFT_3466250 [Mycena olivaceomarginata]|nr:hypothetical protein B0H14DRAFT_3466250 [Mycena olivaceomarginata]
MLPRCAASPSHARFHRHRDVAVKPAPVTPLHTLMPPSFSCGRLFYRSPVAPLDLHVMSIAQLCAAWRFHSRSAVAFTLSILLRPCPLHQLPFPPPSRRTLLRVIKSADQQVGSSSAFPSSAPFPLLFLPPAFLPQVAGPEERARIVDATCVRDEEIRMHRCVPFLSSSFFVLCRLSPRATLGSATEPFSAVSSRHMSSRRKIVAYMRGRIIDLVMNCCGYHVLQKALECKEEVCLLIVSELLWGDPATTLVNEHASGVWHKITELSWTLDPTSAADLRVVRRTPLLINADSNPSSLIVNKFFKGNTPPRTSLLEHRSEKNREMTLEHLLTGLLEFATNEQGSKSLGKALEEGRKETLDRVAQ